MRLIIGPVFSLIAICVSHSWAGELLPEPIEWTESKDVQRLEAITVGTLPDERLDAPTLLAYYNKRLDAHGQTTNLHVIFQSPPDELKNDLLWRDLFTPGYLQGMGLLAPLGIESEKDIRGQIEKLNLRQFLWLICHAYIMNISYSELHITIGYGFSSHQVISLQ